MSDEKIVSLIVNMLTIVYTSTICGKLVNHVAWMSRKDDVTELVYV